MSMLYLLAGSDAVSSMRMLYHTSKMLVAANGVSVLLHTANRVNALSLAVSVSLLGAGTVGGMVVLGNGAGTISVAVSMKLVSADSSCHSGGV